MLPDALDLTQNRLLAALPPEDRDRLCRRLEPVDLLPRQVLVAAGAAFEHIHFPVSGVASLLAAADETVLEIGLIGREGMVGLPVLFGTAASPNMSVAVQIPGMALRMSAEALRTDLDRNAAFRALLLRYAEALLCQIAQSAICNRLHGVEQRLARWLLMAQDRAEADLLPLTQEYISLMLGVRRPGVTVAAGNLAKAGLIRGAYGRIVILDRKGLEASACGCYGVVRRHFERLLAEHRLTPPDRAGR